MIKTIIFDVDGTLTDGRIILDDNGKEIKQFSVHDGLIIRLLPEININTIILTGRKSNVVFKRSEDLHIAHIIQGVSNKKDKLLELGMNIDLKSAAYIGDDLNDYAAMLLCGFKACPANSTKEIQQICDYISPYSGGDGAVRDIVEHILKNQGQWNTILNFFN